MKNLFIFSLIVTAFIAQVSAYKKLIFVQQLFRHGARYPIYPSKIDNTEYTTDEHSTGQLTTQGKNMHYLLGKAIYKQYWQELFKGTAFYDQYNNSKFFIKSTDVNRTIESCQSHLMGIFDNLPKLKIGPNQVNFSKPLWPDVQAIAGQVFPTGPAFHPLPIHVQKLGTDFAHDGDFLRAYSPQNCPNQDVWQKQNQQTQFVKQVYSNPNFVKTLQQLSKILKRNVTFEDQGYYYDNFETTYYMGRPTLAIFTDPKYKRDLQYIYTLDLYINLFYSDHQIRTTSNGFFKATLQNIQRAIKRKDIQWVIYSAHDTTVGNMLAALNLTNAACIYESYLKGDDYNSDKCIPIYPGYTANIIFEVWEDTDTTLQTVKIRYLGKYRKIPFCGYQQQCQVSKMKSWYESSIKIQSFAANCGLYNEDKQFYKAAAIMQLGIILVFIIYAILRHLKRPHFVEKQKNNSRSQIGKTMLTQQLNDHQ